MVDDDGCGVLWWATTVRGAAVTRKEREREEEEEYDDDDDEDEDGRW